MSAEMDAQPQPAEARTSRRSTVLDWYTRNCDLEKGDPATRAQLRRCRNRTDALMIPAAVGLARRLGALGRGAHQDDEFLGAALDLARVLAHVKRHDKGKRVMQAAGWKTFPGERKESDAGNDRPLLSQVRFRRLLTTDSGEPQVNAFVRLVKQLEGTVNVPELTDDFLGWAHESRRARIRNKWAFDYYAAGAAAPKDSEVSPENEEEEQ